MVVAPQTHNKAASSSNLNKRYYTSFDVVSQSERLHLNSSHIPLQGGLALSIHPKTS